MEGEPSARLAEVRQAGKGELSRVCELYGLTLTVLPSALVLALTQPLLLQPVPTCAPISVTLPARLPRWWSGARPFRSSYLSRGVGIDRDHGMRNSGTSTK
jgi:hypothetical protein